MKVTVLHTGRLEVLCPGCNEVFHVGAEAPVGSHYQHKCGTIIPWPKVEK